MFPRLTFEMHWAKVRSMKQSRIEHMACTQVLSVKLENFLKTFLAIDLNDLKFIFSINFPQKYSMDFSVSKTK